MVNKIWNQFYGLSPERKEREYRTRPGGSGYESLKMKLAEHGLTLCSSYNKWYNIYDDTGSNVRYDPFDSLADVREWMKTEMSAFLKAKT